MATFYLQLKGFGLSFLIGVLGGWLYDFYHVASVLFRLRARALVALGDTLFWFCLTGVACFFLFMGNTGGVRFYTFLGMLTGFLFYRRFFHRLTLSWVTSFCLLLGRYLTYPKRFFCLVIQFCSRRFSHLLRRKRGPET